MTDKVSTAPEVVASELSPERREEIMLKWDNWRQEIANGCEGSWPRDAFESELDAKDDMIRALSAEVEKLKVALRDIRDYPLVCSGMPVNHDSWISCVITKARAALGE